MASKSKSRNAARKARREENPLAQLGLFKLPSIDIDDEEGSDVDEGELESELEALMSGENVSKPRHKKKPAPGLDIEKLAAECLKDSDDDHEDDSNLSGDEELIAELTALVPDPSSIEEPETQILSAAASDTPGSLANPTVAILEERLNLYMQAIEIAKISGDAGKSRRYERALKTIKELLKSVKSGFQINEEDIPPIINLPKPKPRNELVKPVSLEVVPTLSPVSLDENAPEQSVTDENGFSTTIKTEELPLSMQLATRRDQYKMAALKAKKLGDTQTAIAYVRIAKKFDAVIEAEKAGQPVDLSNMPPPPSDYFEQKQISPMKNGDAKISQQETQKSSAMEEAALAAASEPEDPGMFAAPPPPTSVKEALQQRLDKYITTRDAAQAEGNSGKVRRLQRIVKQYEVAIKDYTTGKTVDFDELPTPPGFAPIPKKSVESSVPIKPPKPSPEAQQEHHEESSPSTTRTKSSPNPQENVPASQTKPTAPERKLRRMDTSTVLEKQLEFLLERQKLFRQAALASKKNGDIQQAKEYLRMSKGFDSMIEATKSGLPIDATTIPTPPQLESEFVIIEASECVSHEEGSKEKLFESLEHDLAHQIEVCTRNKDNFLRLGDVSSSSKFEKLALESRKDLSLIQYLKLDGEPLPRFRYETRLFSIVKCHTDLADKDLEVTVERGINLPGKPDELDSYVRLEFPIPPETPQCAKTHTIKDTINPVFQQEFKFEINRKSRSQLRHFKRQSLKLNVFSKGGFLRGDTLLGTVNIKLLDLESKCFVHESFDLMDGRRASGGKLEVKIRIRDPLLVKQVEEIKEKWLIIGS